VIEERRAVPTLLARADEAIKWHAVKLPDIEQVN
jgi:hypothetical protein